MKAILVDNVLKESLLVVVCSFLFFALLSQVLNCFIVNSFYSGSKKLKLNQVMVSLMFFLSSTCFTLSTIAKDNSILNEPLKEVGKKPEIANKMQILHFQFNCKQDLLYGHANSKLYLFVILFLLH